MSRLKTLTRLTSFLLALFVVCAGTARAAKISGTISSTMTITEDSELMGDVTCTVTGAPCIAIGASHVTLNLSGFTMTGQADPQTGCSGGPSTFAAGVSDDGIDVNAQTGVVIRGPGVVQRFRAFGIWLINSTGVTVAGVTTSTNCLSGIFVTGGSEHDLQHNVAVRNGNSSFPCGGI